MVGHHMAMSERDRQNVTADSLIGYSLSAPSILTSDKAGQKRWVQGIVELANALAKKMDNATRESSDKA
jgi:hypothetical protein